MMKKLILMLCMLLLLCSCVDGATKIGLDRLNWSQSFPAGENITLDGGFINGMQPGGDVRVYVIGPLVIALSPWFLPIDWGISGEGGDDYSVVQSALDYVESDGLSTTLSLHGRYFYIDQDLLMPNGILIQGNNATLKQDSTNSTVHDSLLRDKNPTEIKYRSVQIQNLKLDGIDKTYVNYCLNLSRVQYGTFIDVACDHAKNEGFRIRDDSWGNMFLNCHTYDNGGYGFHFMAGPNDKPNCCLIIGGRIMADDNGGIHIEAGTDIRVTKSSIESTGTAAYVLDNQSIFDGNYIEACTNGFYWGDGTHTVYGMTLINNHMYSVTNPAMAVANFAGSITMTGNTVDAVSIDTWMGTGTGNGAKQTIDWPATLLGHPFSVDCWPEEDASDIPIFSTVYSTRKLYITTTSGIDYRYIIRTGF